MKKKSNELTQIKSSLPYCLFKVDSRFFKLNDGHSTKIRFTKIKTIPNRRTADSVNMDTIRDRWGIDAHSDVFILTEKIFNNAEEAKCFTLKTINNFIRLYRYYNEAAVHLVDLNKEDLFNFSCFNQGRGNFELNLAGGISMTDPMLNFRISNEIEQSLNNNFKLPFWEELLMDSKQYIYQANYRHSILESVIALEYVVSKFIKEKCLNKGIHENDIKKYIKDVGLTGNIKTTLILLIEDQLPEDEVFEKCKAGITIRNKIVHQGMKEVNINEAEETYKFNKKLIEFLSKYID